MKEIHQMGSHIPAPHLTQAIDLVLTPPSKEISIHSLDIVRFTSDGETMRLDATNGRHIWGSEIEVELPAFQFFVSVEDCKAIRKVCKRKNGEITVEFSNQILTFESSKGGKIEVCPIDEISSNYPSNEDYVDPEEVSITRVLDPAEAKRRERMSETLLWMQQDLAVEVGRVPEEFLTVVHRFGLSMSDPKPTGRYPMTFQFEFRKWLRDRSMKLVDASLSEAASFLRLDFEFDDKYIVFESLREVAEWETTLEYREFEVVISEFINDGFPIYEFGLGDDGSILRRKPM